MTTPHTRSRAARRLAAAGLTVAVAVAIAACGSASPSASSSSTSTSTGSASGAATKGITISTAQVPGFGTVLVNGDGRTLYMLTSEQGGKITCTDENGCTKTWPDTELPDGVTAATAGTGVNASLLGTVKGTSGSLYVTYHGWPLYTYAPDSAAGQAYGEGITSFGGTWYVLDASGNPVESKSGGASSSTSMSGSPGY